MKKYYFILVIFMLFSIKIQSQSIWNVKCIIENSRHKLFMAASYGSDLELKGCVFRSIDNGNTWSKVFYNDGKITNLCSNSKGDLFFLADSIYYPMHIYRSVNDGDSWTNIKAINSNLEHILAIDSQDHLFANQGNIIYRSLNNGDSWNEIEIGLGSNHSNSISCDSKGNVFAAVSDRANMGGIVYRSLNNGLNWESTSTNGFGWLAVAMVGIGSNDVVFAQTFSFGTFRSSDSGDNWAEVNTSFALSGPFFLASEDTIYACGFNRLLYSYDNGINWQNTVISEAGTINSVLVTSEKRIIIGSSTGLYYSDDNGISWTPFSIPVRIYESTFNELIKVYPNPVVDILYIEGIKNELTNISILSLDGKLLIETVNLGINQFDMSKIKEGIYIVKINNSKTLITQKIFKK